MLGPDPSAIPFPVLSEHDFVGRQVTAVSGRELHAALGVGKKVSTWMTLRIHQLGFVQGEDYVESRLPNFGKKGRGRDFRAVFFTVDAAKGIAMAEHNAAGAAVRAYFIRCEEELRLVDAERARLAAEALRRDLEEARARMRDLEAAAAEASAMADENAILGRSLRVAQARLALRDAEDEYRAESRRQGRAADGFDTHAGDRHAGDPRDPDPHAAGASRGGGDRPGSPGPDGGPSRRGRSDAGGPTAAPEGEPPRKRRPRRGRQGTRVTGGDPIIKKMLGRAGWRFVAYTGVGALGPNETTAGDACARLYGAWGMDDAVTILKALSRNRHRLARTTMAIRPLAELAGRWPEMLAEDGILDAIAAIDFGAIDDALRDDGVIYAIKRMSGFRDRVEDALRRAVGASRAV